MSDSIWATILGLAKTLNVNEKYILHDISFINALLYSRSVPVPGDTDDDTDTMPYDAKRDACDPNNFEDIEEQIIKAR